MLEVLCLEVGTSVACATKPSAETIFEIVKFISDVDMPARGRMGSKCEIFRFFNSGYAHDRNIPGLRPHLLGKLIALSGPLHDYYKLKILW